MLSAAHAIGGLQHGFRIDLGIHYGCGSGSTCDGRRVREHLRSVNVHQDVISALRIPEVTIGGLFVSLGSTEEGLEASATEAFEIQSTLQKKALCANERSENPKQA